MKRIGDILTAVEFDVCKDNNEYFMLDLPIKEAEEELRKKLSKFKANLSYERNRVAIVERSLDKIAQYEDIRE